MVRTLFLLLVCLTAADLGAANPKADLHLDRTSPGDLEVSGELAGLPPGVTRYIRYEDLLQLPQESYTVIDDPNLPKQTTISGVALSTLVKLFAESPEGVMVVAICYDHYRTNYPRDYMAEHHPLLVLRIQGQRRNRWPAAENGGALGPYLISHPFFKPAFKVLSHEDEPQIPFGVVRLEFRREVTVYSAIYPPGDWPAHSPVEEGYTIARQDCFRCHNMGPEGGTMAGESWMQLASIASAHPDRFRQIIHDPKSIDPKAKMPAHKDYDGLTLDALTAYFRTFARAHAAPGRKP